MRILECILGLALLAACGKEAPKEDHDHAHDHKHGPHDGEVTELPGGLACLEIVHDHEGGSMVVYVLAPDLKTPLEVEAPVVNLTQGAVQFALTPIDAGPDGKASAFKGAHEGLKTDPWDGRIRVNIGGKMHQVPLEGHAH